MTVAVPSYRRPARLARCLEALCAQTMPADRFEVVVCDDGSPEPLAAVGAPFRDRLRLAMIAQRNAGPAAARNAAARHGAGPLLAFTDDDCLPTPTWLARLVAHAARHPGHLVGGAIANALPDDPYAAASQLIGDAVVAHAERHALARRFFSTSNLLVPADAFRRLGGFSETFPRAAGEDHDFCARWHDAGLPSSYAPDAVVRHAHAHTLGSFVRQHFDYGRGLLRVRQRMAHRAGGRTRFEAPRFYAHLVTYALRRERGARALRAAALVVLAQAATAAGGAREALAGGREADPAAS